MIMLSNQNIPIHQRKWYVLEAHLAEQKNIEVMIAGDPLHLLNPSPLKKHLRDLFLFSEIQHQGEAVELRLLSFSAATSSPELARQAVECLSKRDDRNQTISNAKLDILLISDKKFIDLDLAKCSNPNDEVMIEAVISQSKEEIGKRITSLICKHVAAYGSFGAARLDLPTDADVLDLRGIDLGQPAVLIQFAAWLLTAPKCATLVLDDCQLHEKSCKILSKAIELGTLAKLKKLEVTGSDEDRLSMLHAACARRCIQAIRRSSLSPPRSSGYDLASLYACIVVQPAPVLISPGRTRAELEGTVRTIQDAITKQCGWRAEGKAPLCILDGDPLNVLITLQRSWTHSLIWFGTGYEEVACSTPEPVTIGAIAEFVKALQERSRPRVVFICLQYGARHAAELLAAECVGVRTVLWINTRPAVSKVKVLVEVVRPMLDLLEQDQAPAHVKQQFEEWLNSIDLDGGCVVLSRGPCWRNPFAALTPFVQRNVRHLPPNNLVKDINDIAAASQLLVSDLKYARQLQVQLARWRSAVRRASVLGS